MSTENFSSSSSYEIINFTVIRWTIVEYPSVFYFVYLLFTLFWGVFPLKNDL